ncbi:hypothetical protein [Methylogaea oryzae]|uniref:hypothetical protein n=1 Tax=Methylogaea oryzae TaxID=1295382 RepID=UPI001C3F3E13|nr:hypothetical protein [Methylogaea oryzae]
MVRAVAGRLFVSARHVAVLRHPHLFQREMLLGELAGGVVVDNGQSRALQAFVRDDGVQVGQSRRRFVFLGEVNDFQGLARRRGGRSGRFGFGRGGGFQRR